MLFSPRPCMIGATCARVGGESRSASSTSLLPRHEAEEHPRVSVVVEGSTEKCSPCCPLRKFVTDAVVLQVVYANGIPLRPSAEVATESDASCDGWCWWRMSSGTTRTGMRAVGIEIPACLCMSRCLRCNPYRSKRVVSFKTTSFHWGRESSDGTVTATNVDGSERETGLRPVWPEQNYSW